MAGGARIISSGEGLAQALKRITKKAKKGFVQAGVLKGATYTDGSPVAPVASANEWGEGGNTPLAFMRTTVAENQAKWGKGFGVLMKDSGNDSEKSLALLGEQMKADIKRTLKRIGDAGGNSEETIARKGFDRPGVDTGTMEKAIEFEVVMGEPE